MGEFLDGRVGEIILADIEGREPDFDNPFAEAPPDAMCNEYRLCGGSLEYDLKWDAMRCADCGTHWMIHMGPSTRQLEPARITGLYASDSANYPYRRMPAESKS